MAIVSMPLFEVRSEMDVQAFVSPLLSLEITSQQQIAAV